MNSTEPVSKFEHWIFNSFQPAAEGLALYRIFTALFILFFALPSFNTYVFLGNLPSDFFAPPPGPMMLFDGFPPEEVLLTVHILLITSLITLCLGWRTKISSFGVGIFMLTLNGFIYSLGKIDHFILVPVVPLIMAFSGWGATYSVDKLRSKSAMETPQGWPLVLLALLIGFMMFTAGFPKILGGWLHLDTQATQGHYFKQFFVRGRQDLLAPYGQHIGRFWWEVLDYVTIAFEVGFLVAIINPRSTRIFICIAVLFHFCTMLILNISFLPNFLAYAAFINWAWVDAKAGQYAGFGSKMKRLAGPLLITVCMLLFYAITWFLGNVYPQLLKSDWGVVGMGIVLCAVPVAVWYLFRELQEFVE